MYSSWTSLQCSIQADSCINSILRRFPEGTGRDVVSPVVKCISAGLSVGGSEQPSRLVTEQEVNWVMEVICYGLFLPFSEHELVRDCVNIYCEWMSVLVSPKLSVPRALVENPGSFCQKMFSHLYNLFIPRDKNNPDHVKRQVVLCHRTLRTVQTHVKDSKVMNRDTWESLLKLLLAVTDTLLAPPREKDSLGEQLSERVVAVLFELWLLSCPKFFPVPSFWRTFRDMCSNWRHYEVLIVQWNRVNVALTASLIKTVYRRKALYLEVGVDDQDVSELTKEYVQHLSNECLVQCWFRFLHILGNPADLCCVDTICGTPKFKHYALTSSQVVEPNQHECLLVLPKIFLRAIKGVSLLVDAFLDSGSSQPNIVALSQRKVNIWPSETPGQTFHAAVPSSNTASGGLERPSCNSLLHVFGAWFFDAAMGSTPRKRKQPGSGPRLDNQIADHDTSSGLNFDLGRAEACGTLCKIVRSLRTGETIEPVYLARFYIVLNEALELPEPPNGNGEVMTYCLANMAGLFCIDLTGVNSLLPCLMAALEPVLTTASSAYPFRVHEQVSAVELRKSACHTLLSIACLPLHYGSLEISDLLTGRSSFTYSSLRGRITRLVLDALKVESDSANTTMLLAVLALLVQDSSSYESRVEEHEVDPRGSMATSGGIAAGGGSETSSSDAFDEASAAFSHPPPSHPPPLLTSADLDTASGLFSRAALVVTTRLIAVWKLDLGLTLSALEVLTSLSKTRLSVTSSRVCRDVVRTLCDLIVYLCSRPPKNQLRDLHSVIVAALLCLCSWLAEHPYVLQVKECLYWVLEVVELGISGRKSQGTGAGNDDVAPELKADKTHMPVSQRVKDAAEVVLECIMDQAESFPCPCGADSLYSTLSEQLLLHDEVDAGFKYFALGSLVIVGVLEDYSERLAAELPQVKVVVRGPFGRQAWCMQLKLHAQPSTQWHLRDIGRPLPQKNLGICHTVKQRYFPATVDVIPFAKVETSLPSLDQVIIESREGSEKMTSLLRNQAAFEHKVANKAADVCKKLEFPDPGTECKASMPSKTLQVARMLLSQLGFLSTDALSSQSGCLVSLSSKSKPGFAEELEQLDKLPNRTHDTAFIYYVRSGQCSAKEILENVKSRHTVDHNFLEFLESLGWAVDIRRHCGWTGTASTSWKSAEAFQNTGSLDGSAPSDNAVHIPGHTGGSVYDGHKWILYWADCRSETAFIVPSRDHGEAVAACTHPVGVSEETLKGTTDSSAHTHSVNTASKGASATASYTLTSNDLKVAVVWLECYEDHENFPLSDLLPVEPYDGCINSGTGTARFRKAAHMAAASREWLVIYVHSLKSGLLRVHLRSGGPTAPSVSASLPLADSMVASRRSLGALVRQAVINAGNRRRLECDLSQVPHNRRNAKIQELINKYRVQLSEPELLAELFSHAGS